MPEIRAFVGHSFSPGDAAVVTAFLSYFEELQRVLPSFSWVHAQAAEPRELAQKVLSLMADRNVFIGICTRRELVIASPKLKPTLLPAGGLKAKADAFEWKTSEWVIQEIGLALGRGISLVLLLEIGCRRPGGLQGDVEFIPFDRDAPERAFVKLLEMIRALTPASRPTGAAATEGPQEAPSDLPRPTPSAEDETPNASWDRDRYDQAFFWRLINNKGAETAIADPERAAFVVAVPPRLRIPTPNDAP